MRAYITPLDEIEHRNEMISKHEQQIKDAEETIKELIFYGMAHKREEIANKYWDKYGK